jgi:hypothetical protein
MNRALALSLLLCACSPGDVGRGPAAAEGGTHDPLDGSNPPPVPGVDGAAPLPGSDAANPQPGEDAGDPSAGGMVPVFLAVGYQSHRIVSCDQGLTWTHEEMAASGGGDDGTLMRGLAYGKNKFVASVGGGGTQELWVTDDGITWNMIKRSGNGYSDVTFGNGRFVAGGGHISVISQDGENWMQDGTMGEGGILRNLAFTNYMGGRFAAAGDGGRRMNSSDGVSWGAQVQEGESLEGIAGGKGIFVAIAGSGATRYSTDGGATWQTGSIGSGGARGIIHDGEQFIVSTGNRSYVSTDGVNWDSKGSGAGPYDFAVNDQRTHYVGVDAGIILHSSDGATWTKVHEGGPGYERVKFGWVKPSAACPAP